MSTSLLELRHESLGEGLWSLDLAPPPATERCIHVLAGDQPLAIGIASVRDVLPRHGIAPIPRAPAWVLGLTNVRGTIVGVVDLARFLQIGRLESAAGCLLVCAAGTRTVALAVAAARSIVDYLPGTTTPVADLGGRLGRYVRVAVPVGGEPVPVLAVDRLLADEDLVHP